MSLDLGDVFEEVSEKVSREILEENDHVQEGSGQLIQPDRLLDAFTQDTDIIYDKMKLAREKLQEQEIMQEKILTIKQKKLCDLTLEEKKIILPILEGEIIRENNIEHINKRRIQELINERLVSNSDN